MAKAKGDRSKKVGSIKQSKGPAAPVKSMAKGPRGKPCTFPGGAVGYRNQGRVGGTPVED